MLDATLRCTCKRSSMSTCAPRRDAPGRKPFPPVPRLRRPAQPHRGEHATHTLCHNIHAHQAGANLARTQDKQNRNTSHTHGAPARRPARARPPSAHPSSKRHASLIITQHTAFIRGHRDGLSTPARPHTRLVCTAHEWWREPSEMWPAVRLD